MKEIKYFFDIKLALKQYDVHWIEEQLFQLREEGERIMTCQEERREVVCSLSAIPETKMLTIDRKVLINEYF